MRLDIRKKDAIKEGDRIIGHRVKVKVVKNKVSPPFRSVEFDLIFGVGISRVGEILDLAVEHNVIKKSGSWFSYNDSKLAQGREAVKNLLQDNPELQEEIEGKLKEQLLGEPASTEEEEPEEE